MNRSTYLLSFIGASLVLPESIVVAEKYLQHRDWEKVREDVLADNLLQTRTQRSAVRIYGELSKRLRLLPDEYLEFFVAATLSEQKQLLWYAICNCYAFVHDFAVEVLHEKFLRMDYQMTRFDYEAFFNRKADWHGELDAVTRSTRNKMRTILFRMMREADLLNRSHVLQPVILADRLVALLADQGPDVFRIYPAPAPVLDTRGMR
jgi:hypothetical protein